MVPSPLPSMSTSTSQTAKRSTLLKTPGGTDLEEEDDIFIDRTNRDTSIEEENSPLSSDTIIPAKIFHHVLHSHEPIRKIVTMPSAGDSPLSDSLTHNLKSQDFSTSPQSTNVKRQVVVKEDRSTPREKQVETITKSDEHPPLPAEQSQSPIPLVVDHPENDVILSRDAEIKDPHNTVIMANNAVIINNAPPQGISDGAADADDARDGKQKVKHTRDGKTKVVGGKKDSKKNTTKETKKTTVVKDTHSDSKGNPKPSGKGEKDTTVIETKTKQGVKNGGAVEKSEADGGKTPKKTTTVVEKREGDEGVQHGTSPKPPNDGREVQPSSTKLTAVPHSPAESYTTTGSSPSYSTYSSPIPSNLVAVPGHLADPRSPYSALTLQPDRVLLSGGTPSTFTSATPSSAFSRGTPLSKSSRVGFRIPHEQHGKRGGSPHPGPQAVGDRIEPGPPSLYSPLYTSSSTSYSGSHSPSSTGTSRTRAKSIDSKPSAAYPRAQTPVVKETRELKSVNREVQFFTKSVDQVSGILTVDPRQGLDDGEAQNRVGIFGKNELKKEKKVSPFRLFLGQLVTALNVILLIAGVGAIVSAVVEGSYGWIEGVVIVFIIFSNSVIGFSQEYRSAKTLESLMNMFAPEAEVMRNGQRKTIQADQLVPGDVVLLEDGDCVPADLRICEGFNLSIDEAVITGESEPVNKVFEPIKPEEGEALGDRKNMAYMSSVVCGGRGKGLVVRTGEDTELGQIAEKLRTSDKDKKKTHLQQSMTKLGYVLLLCAVALSFIVLAIQVLAVGTDAFGERYTWLYVVALCVAIIPEGLPAILALTLAVGMRQMAKKNAIVRKLGVLESLNWITDICSDKTGTLTEGKMMATMMWTENNYFKVAGSGIIPEGQITEKGGGVVSVETLEVDRTLTLLLYVCSLCNMATLTHQDEEWTATSSPTEIALQVLAYKAGLGKPKLEQEYRYLGEHPFDSNSKRMSVAYEKRDEPVSGDDPVEGRDSEAAPGEASKTYLFMKGSLESVTKFCSYYRDEDGDEVEFDDDIMAMIQDQAEAMAGHGLRVLSMAYKCNFQFDPKGNRDTNDEGSTFLGLVGIMDPPRPQSRPAVEKAHAAGINVYMLTGDHKKTAGSIAKQVNIIENEATDKVMIGSEFENAKVAELPKVVARCNPNTKIKMIDELHSRDRFVCMTGDGVNDAPAIKKSDVGVAMGQNGSEVTKDSADIVLLDDNFGTIIVAIEEGRRVFSNIGKIMLHLLTNSFSLIIVLVFGLIFSFFVDEDVIVFPLSPMQILWLNVITDTPMNCALGFEPATPDIMAHPPRTKGEGLFTIELSVDVLYYGVIAGALSLANFGITLFTSDDGPLDIEDVYGKDIEVAAYRARAVCFVTLTYCMLVQIFNCVHPRNSVLMYRGKNIWLWITVLAGAILVFPTLYIPWVNVYVFLHYHLTWVEWIQVFAAVAIFAILSEVYKIFKRCVMGGYRNGHYLIHLAERTTNSISDMNRLMVLQTERMDPDRKEETEIELI